MFVIGATRLICIDGPAGSGKTTLARTLSAVLHASVVHMDQMYNGWNETLVDSTWQRVVQQVLEPVRRGVDASIDVYDWLLNMRVPASFTWTDVLIIEGVGSFHPLIAEHADDLVWVDVEDDVHIERVVARDGENVRAPMQAFIRQQQKYFDTYRVEERANLRLVSVSGTVGQWT